MSKSPSSVVDRKSRAHRSSRFLRCGLSCANHAGSGADRVMLSFSTSGDTCQDPVTFDSTTTPLSAQDALWLKNTKAWSRIMCSVQAQQRSMLFFYGDTIMGSARTSYRPTFVVMSTYSA